MFIARCVLKGDVSVTRLIMLHWTGGYLGPGGVREILPYPSTLVGSYPPPLLVLSRHIKRKHDTPSYYLKFSANPLREHVKFLSRHTRWVAGSCALLAYRSLQAGLTGRLSPGQLVRERFIVN